MIHQYSDQTRELLSNYGASINVTLEAQLCMFLGIRAIHLAQDTDHLKEQLDILEKSILPDYHKGFFSALGALFGQFARQQNEKFENGYGFEKFQSIKENDFQNEISVISFLEAVYDTLDEFGDEALTGRYFALIKEFIERYNLRYTLLSFRLWYLFQPASIYC